MQFVDAGSSISLMNCKLAGFSVSPTDPEFEITIVYIQARSHGGPSGAAFPNFFVPLNFIMPRKNCF